MGKDFDNRSTDQLKKSGQIMPSKYFLCKKGEESIDHLLLHYPKASMLW